MTDDFRKRWSFPHCMGAIDGEHVALRCPRKSCSNVSFYLFCWPQWTAIHFFCLEKLDVLDDGGVPSDEFVSFRSFYTDPAASWATDCAYREECAGGRLCISIRVVCIAVRFVRICKESYVLWIIVRLIRHAQNTNRQDIRCWCIPSQHVISRQYHSDITQNSDVWWHNSDIIVMSTGHHRVSIILWQHCDRMVMWSSCVSVTSYCDNAMTSWWCGQLMSLWPHTQLIHVMS